MRGGRWKEERATSDERLGHTRLQFFLARLQALPFPDMSENNSHPESMTGNQQLCSYAAHPLQSNDFLVAAHISLYARPVLIEPGGRIVSESGRRCSRSEPQNLRTFNLRL